MLATGAHATALPDRAVRCEWPSEVAAGEQLAQHLDQRITVGRGITDERRGAHAALQEIGDQLANLVSVVANDDRRRRARTRLVGQR